MIKPNQWDDPELNIDPPEEPALYCCECGEIIRKGEKYFPLNGLGRRRDDVVCMDCIETFSEEA